MFTFDNLDSSIRSTGSIHSLYFGFCNIRYCSAAAGSSQSCHHCCILDTRECVDVLQTPNARNVTFVVALFLNNRKNNKIIRQVNHLFSKSMYISKSITFSVHARICSTCLSNLNRKSVIACNLSAKDLAFGGAAGRDCELAAVVSSPLLELSVASLHSQNTHRT